MSTSGKTSIHSVPSEVDENPGVYHTHPSLPGSPAYNAGMLEEVEERFERQDNRRVARAWQDKLTRRPAREHWDC